MAAELFTDHYTQDISKGGLADGVHTFMALDLDNANGTGIFKHPASTKGFQILRVGGAQHKATPADDWFTLLAVLTRVGTTDSDAHIFYQGEILGTEGETLLRYDPPPFYPLPLDLTVSQGKLTRFGSAERLVAFPGITAGTALDDTEGNAITPAVGDVILCAKSFSGAPLAGNLDVVHYSIQYVPVL